MQPIKSDNVGTKGGYLIKSFLSCIGLFLCFGCVSMEKQEGVIIAHRGASGYLPENTLQAMTLAHGMDPDYIEQDVVLTRDNQAIVLHDIHLDLVTNVLEVFPLRVREDGRFYAIDFSLAEIKTLRVNERIDLESRLPVYPKRFPIHWSSFQIPTLEEAIDLILGLNRTRGKNIGLFTEIKAPAWHQKEGKDISKIVLAILNKKGFTSKSDRVFVQCFDPIELKRIRFDLKSQLKILQLIDEDNGYEAAEADFTYLQTPEGLSGIASYSDGIGPWLPQVIKGRESNGSYRVTSLVDQAHQYGLKVHVYTLRADDLPGYVKDYKELVDAVLRSARADGIFTDFPDRAVGNHNRR